MSIATRSYTLIVLGLGILFSAAHADNGQLAFGTKGMVSTAHPLATEAGLAMLKAGGNAFDAAVAIASTLNVVEPQNSGLGGYGIILIYDAKNGRVRTLNTSGRLPQSTDSDVFRPPTPDYIENRRSAKAISTPTNLNGYSQLSKNYGSKPWAELFDRAIGLAENGHPINASLARSIGRGYSGFPDEAKTSFGINGRPLTEGETLIQKNLAKAYRLIAKEGPAAIYGGAIGRALHDTVQEAGGFVTMADLMNNEAEWWEPITINFRGYDIMTASPPGNSFSSLIRLGIMERFDLKSLGHNTTEYLHLFAEVTKHAFWCRLKYAGDPGVKAPPLDRLLSDDYFDNQAAMIDLSSATNFVPPGLSAPKGNHTTHFVVADRWGNVLSATQTLGGGFGSRIMVKDWGIWLNNSMYFCTFEPKGNPMDAHPGRRKLNSNHPTFVMKDGKPWIALGTPGGHTIGQTVPQIVINMLDFDMDVHDAIAAPRVAFTEPNNLAVEEALSEDLRNALAALGHTIKTTPRIGNAHGLAIEYDSDGSPSRFTGGADPRGRGKAMGW